MFSCAQKDTCCLTALSLNLSMKRHPRIWAAQHLPYDAHRVIPVPSGGALVLCTHMVLFFTQASQQVLPGPRPHATIHMVSRRFRLGLFVVAATGGPPCPARCGGAFPVLLH